MSEPGQRQGGVDDVLTEPRSRDSSELTAARSGSVSSVEEVRGLAVVGRRRRQQTSASVVDVVAQLTSSALCRLDNLPRPSQLLRGQSKITSRLFRVTRRLFLTDFNGKGESDRIVLFCRTTVQSDKLFTRH